MSIWARQKKRLNKSIVKAFKLEAIYTARGGSSSIPLDVNLLSKEVEVESDGSVMYAEAIEAEFFKSQISELNLGDSFICMGEKYQVDVLGKPKQDIVTALVVKKGAA